MPVGRSGIFGGFEAASGDQVCWLPRLVQPFFRVLPVSPFFQGSSVLDLIVLYSFEYTLPLWLLSLLEFVNHVFT